MNPKTPPPGFKNVVFGLILDVSQFCTLPKVMESMEEVAGSQYWDFSAQSPLFDFCLHVEERQLWVPRAVLACHSEPLRSLIYGPYKEKDREETDLPGKSYEDVLEWLRCFVPCPKLKPIDGKN